MKAFVSTVNIGIWFEKCIQFTVCKFIISIELGGGMFSCSPNGLKTVHLHFFSVNKICWFNKKMCAFVFWGSKDGRLGLTVYPQFYCWIEYIELNIGQIQQWSMTAEHWCWMMTALGWIQKEEEPLLIASLNLHSGPRFFDNYWMY